MTTEQIEVRTYSHWLRPQTTGLGKLSLPVTLVLLAGLIVSFLLYFISVFATVGGIVLTALLVWMLSTKDRDGLSIVERAVERFEWWGIRGAKSNLYRSGPLSRIPWGSHQLPGLAATTRLYEFHDSADRPFALIYMPSTGHFSVVIGTQPDGAALVDQDQVDAWVANWGGWLASLVDEPGLVQATVTVDTAPDSPFRLQQKVEASIDPEAPSFAQQVMREIVVRYPEASARTASYIALTFEGARMLPGRSKRELAEVGDAIANRLVWITAGLEATGAGWAAPVPAAELCEVVRVAYDPAAASLVDSIHAEGGETELSWDSVGPAAHEAGWDYYRHDAGISKTWTMSVAPRGVVRERVLARLLAPNARVQRKRVTLRYKPIDPGVAAEVVDRDLRDARSAALGASENTHAGIRLESARRTAAEEASGSALVLFGMSVTATVTDADAWDQLDGVIGSLTKSARLRLRPAYGQQDAAFAGTLPLGIVPELHNAAVKGYGDALQRVAGR